MIASKTVGTRAACYSLLLLASATPARAECKPAAVAQGDPALVRTLSASLESSGIATTSAIGCPWVSVRVEPRGQQVHVRLTDTFQRTSERDVQDVSTAAAVVASWTMQEIEAGSLPAVAAPPPAAPSRLAFGASAITLLGDNGATWWAGAGASACIRLGWACAGAALRAIKDTNVSGDAITTAQSTYALDALATLDAPRSLGEFVVSPGIGVGYRYLHVVTTHHDPLGHPMDVPSSDHELRTELHVAVLHRLTDAAAIFAALSGDAALARSDSQFGPLTSLALAIGVRLGAP